MCPNLRGDVYKQHLSMTPNYKTSDQVPREQMCPKHTVTWNPRKLK